jgi:hypothetical protein
MRRYLKYQDIFDSPLISTVLIHAGPLLKNTCNIFLGKPGERQIVTRMENENVACANHGFAG